jgi:Ca2+-binding RTX toxin-like protein
MAWVDVAARLSFNTFDAAERATITNALKAGYDGSAKAKGMLDKLVTQNKILEIEEVAGAFQAFVGLFKLQVDPTFLDDILYLDRNGKAVPISLTTALLHEAVHAIEGIRDTPRDTNTNSEGPTVIFINEIRTQLGTETHRASYEGMANGGNLIKDKEYTGGEEIENALMSVGRRDTTANSPATKDLMVGIGNSNNQFLSGDGRDFLWGNGGNDTLNGGGGNDVIEGGAGTDIAVYTGKCDQYMITEGAGGIWTVQDNRAGSPDGMDIIREVEKLQFSNGNVDVVAGEKIACPGQNIVLLVDTSGSMGDDIAAVRAAAVQIVESLFGTVDEPLNSRFAIVEFHDTNALSTVLPFTNQARIADRKTAALNAVAGLDIIGGGAEPMYGAMIHALDGSAGIWEAGAISNRLIIFSDEPPADPGLQAAAFAAAAALNAQVTQPLSPLFDYETDLPILPDDYTVSVAVLPVVIGSDPAALAAAEAIAKVTGGKVFTAANAAEAAQAVLDAVNTAPVIPGPGGGPSTSESPTAQGIEAGELAGNIRAAIESIRNNALNLVTGSDSASTHEGTPLNDFIKAFGGGDLITGLGGNDFINGNAGTDNISSGEGDDVARGGADNDFANGNAGNDFLFGDLGNDILRGGKGNDVLNGNAGDDRLFGDAGSDLFILSAGNDVIEDFRFSEGDLIAIVQGQSFSLSQGEDGLVITRQFGNTTLLGVDINQFNSVNPIQLI